MKKNLIRIAFGLALALVFLGHSARFYQIPPLNTLDAFAYDTRLRLTAAGGADQRIVIVDVDEKSLAEQLFDQLQRLSAQCALSQVYAQRIVDYRASRPGAAWDGGTTSATK